jgi:HPr kinase/phosphorylase
VKNSTKNLLARDMPHGVFLALFNKGVLLVGPSGCGKSECALALLDRGHQLICDDAPIFTSESGKIIGRSPPSIQHCLEIRGLGIVDVRSLFGKEAVVAEKPLELIINFEAPSSLDAQHERVIQPNINSKPILGIPIPHLTLSLVFSKNMAILVETAVRLVFSPLSPTVQRLLTT